MAAKHSQTANAGDTNVAVAETATHVERGYTGHKAAHLKRFARIEGQVRGIARMVEQDKYCIDVLTQVSAATKALQAVALELLEEHMAYCLVRAVEAGGAEKDAKLQEASDAIARLVRS